MTHEEIQILISAYIDGEVTPSEKAIVEEHLSSCALCQNDFKSYKAVSSSLSKWANESLSPDEEIKIQRNFKRREPMFTTRTAVGLGSTLVLAILILSVLPKNTPVSVSPDFKTVTYVSPIQRKAEIVASASQPAPALLSTNQEAYLKQGVRGSLKAADTNLQGGTKGDQYEPYYMAKGYNITRDAVTDKRLAEGTVAYDASTSRVRMGGESSTYMVNRGDVQFATSVRAYIPSAETGIERCGPFTRCGGDMFPTIYQVQQPEAYRLQAEESSTASYDHIIENPFLGVQENPLSTFSIDVDTASYANVRRFLMNGQMPPKDAVRTEEMINYFHYDYPQPKWGEAFSVNTEMAVCPWNRSHNVVLVGLQGKNIPVEHLPASNLVFLIDVSGSMNSQERLPLIKSAFRLLVEQLRSQDRVSLVVYAGSAGVVLEGASGNEKDRILNAIDALQAGGSTAGGQGIELAYKIAKDHFMKDSNNRVILATDGDFNVGVSDDGSLQRIIEEKRDQGIYLSTIGVGTDNFKDSKMQKLADNGNGNYSYIDTLDEARKVFVKQMGGTLFTIAKDVKIQVEFNPAQVKAYRLIGYEKRMLKKEDFNNDKKDAGELGSGHTVTALYEVVPASSTETFGKVDALKYQTTAPATNNAASDEVLTVKLRYKDPRSKEDKSKLITKAIKSNEMSAPGSENLRFASAVAEFGLLLHGSEKKGIASYLHVMNEAKLAVGEDKEGYRQQFLQMVEKAGLLDHTASSTGSSNSTNSTSAAAE